MMVSGCFWRRCVMRAVRPSDTRAKRINSGEYCSFLVSTFYIVFCVYLFAYRVEETRPNPRRRDTDFVREAVSLATKTQPFAGHKTPPLMCQWPDWAWYRMNLPELMHGTYTLWIFFLLVSCLLIVHIVKIKHIDSKCACENLLCLVVGYKNQGKYKSWGNKDDVHRRHARSLGVFPEIWLPDRNNGDGDPDTGGGGGDPDAGGGALPWRLTTDQINTLELRMNRIM